ncbi:hypothetical protein L6164_027168 [Bauhinia variegata]|uniref:Uncharacterized protein n=1 Tax=Bauhinia variegata TaxID=167791 RepID=A0ACB9LTV2_BAUVA|nr:hypothetical protein L6164_027168 [Bauhinia variegata]
MTPSPPYFSTIATLCFTLCTVTVFSVSTAAQACPSNPETSGLYCPPFTSNPPFPFSSSPGCGHPSIEIKCSTPHSVISINNFSFSVLRYEPNSSSMSLSPHPPETKSKTSLTEIGNSSAIAPNLASYQLGFVGVPQSNGHFVPCNCINVFASCCFCCHCNFPQQKVGRHKYPFPSQSTFFLLCSPSKNCKLLQIILTRRAKLGTAGSDRCTWGKLNDGRIVAVKYLHKHHTTAAAGKAFSTKSFCNEILILSSIDHPNLVKLHGYCSDPRGLLLVYDYVPNGTLADHLHGTKSLYRNGSLTWQVRLDIALQTALAMEYLHFSVVPPIIHRDNRIKYIRREGYEDQSWRLWAL